MLLFITYLMTSVIKERKSIFRNKPTYSKDRYNNRRRTSRPSFGIFCFKHGEIIEDTKYLMVMRRNSYAYEEFIRGSYHIDDINYIRQLMSRITKSEAERIINSEFEELWEDLNKAYSVTTTDPYKLHLAKENFYKIKNMLIFIILMKRIEKILSGMILNGVFQKERKMIKMRMISNVQRENYLKKLNLLKMIIILKLWYLDS